MVGIVSNSAALVAQRNLEVAASQSELSIARLSSGARIIRAADDVAGLAIGTSLASTVSTLRTVLNNTSQASSLLQIADGGAKSIGDILQRQKAIAVQANAGTLSNAERAFLNEEFQALVSQIDQTVTDTKFNSVKLLDGSIFDESTINSKTSNKGSAATATVTIGATIAAGHTISINGVQIAFTTNGDGNTVQVGADQTATATNLLTFLQSTDIEQLKEFTYSTGATNVLTITEKQTGVIGASSSLGAKGLVASNGSITLSGSDLSGGVDGDLEANQTIGSSTVTVGSSDVVGDGILTQISATAQARSTGNVTFTNSAAQGDDVTIGGVTFTFGTGSGEIALGADGTASAANLAIAINEAAASNPGLENVVASASGLVVTLTYTEQGNNTVVVAENSANASSGNITGGAGTGIHVNNIVNNPDFVGTISGFKATYLSSDKVNLEVTIGDFTYSATIDDTTAGRDTTYRFYSNTNGVDGGGFFDIQLASGQGTTVTDQATANTFAARIDAAFSTVSFYQQRDLTDASFIAAGDIYSGATQVGSLGNTSFDFKLAGFNDVAVSDVTFTSPAAGASTGTFAITLADGRVLQNTAVTGASLATGNSLTLTSTTNPNETIIFTNNSGVTLDFSTTSNAAAVEGAFKTGFNLGVGGGGLTFQVGTASTAVIKVAIDNVATSNLYRNAAGVSQTLDVSTADNANTAAAVLDLALDKLTSTRATIGALQSRFDFAASNLTASIQNTEASRSAFLDVDIASESTEFATNQVKLQASISVLAQANQIPQNLLKLIG